MANDTLKRRLVAIKYWHTYQGFPEPTSHPVVRKTLAGIHRVHGKPTEQAKALSLDSLQCLVDYLSQSPALINQRNNALLQIGFFGALRRSELVALRWEYITWVPEKGIELLIPRSKTDKTGEGQICAIPYGDARLCPVTALDAWRTHANLATGAVFGPYLENSALAAIWQIMSILFTNENRENKFNRAKV